MLKTKRLIIRDWKTEDLKPFALLNSDPLVMENFPSILNQAESDLLAARFQEKIDEYGYGFSAVERIDTGEFIGFIGLNYLTQESFPAPFTPTTEIGWRLSRNLWGNGYATEGAKEVLRYAFEDLKLDEVLAMATAKNTKSHAVMKRLGMTSTSADDFTNPKLPESHPLSRCVLYRIKKGTICY